MIGKTKATIIFKQPTYREPFYRKHKSNKIRNIVAITVVAGLFLAIYQLVKTGQQTKLIKLMDRIKSNSCIDEKLANTDSELLEWINTIQEYIELAEKLDKIEKMRISPDEITGRQTPTLEEALEKIEQYNKDKENETLLYELNVDRLLVNYHLNNPQTIKKIADYSKLAVICETAGACTKTDEEAAIFSDGLFIPTELDNYEEGDLIAVSSEDGYGILLNEEYSELIWRAEEIQKTADETGQLDESLYYYDNKLLEQVGNLISDTNYVLVSEDTEAQTFSQNVKIALR